MAVRTSAVVSVGVVIIGGGPTGLLSALLLQRLGISTIVLDAKSGPLEVGRADALNARTQQYLRVVGILDELLHQGITCNTSSTFADGEFKSRQNAWWTSITHCEFPNFLMIGQPVVEETLLSRLAPGTVSFGENVTSVTEQGGSEGPNRVRVETASGLVVQATYAIAADGARSTVRSLLDIPFTGTKPEMTWAVLDTFIDTEFPVCSEIITFQLNGQSRVSWIPRERGMARFYVLLDGGEITQERAEESVRKHMSPHKIEFRETEWFSTFEIKERIASTFISKDGRGNIFLAGDAAHVHSVNGGQGLNTGLADAFALAWRLAAAVRHLDRAGDEEITRKVAKTLRSYDTERRTIARDVINVAAMLVRDTMHTAKQYVATIEKSAGYITGMGVSYEGAGSETLVKSSRAGLWVAGQRCPDLILESKSLKGPRRLYSLVTYGQWLVLAISPGHDVTRKSQSQSVQRMTIIPASETSPDQAEGTAQSQDSSSLVYHCAALDPGDSFVVVVRPDMYVGYAGDVSVAEGYLADNCLLE